MLLVITPLRGIFRTVTVFDLVDATDADMFEAFQVVNELYAEEGSREEYNVTLVPVSLEQLGVWMENNIHPNWLQRITRRIRYTINTLARE